MLRVDERVEHGHRHAAARRLGVDPGYPEAVESVLLFPVWIVGRALLDAIEKVRLRQAHARVFLQGAERGGERALGPGGSEVDDRRPDRRKLEGAFRTEGKLLLDFPAVRAGFQDRENLARKELGRLERAQVLL